MVFVVVVARKKVEGDWRRKINRCFDESLVLFDWMRERIGSHGEKQRNKENNGGGGGEGVVETEAEE